MTTNLIHDRRVTECGLGSSDSAFVDGRELEALGLADTGPFHLRNHYARAAM